MKRYVDVDELLKHKRKMQGFSWSGDFWDEAVLCDDIRNAPTADVAEIVRCEDCVLRDTEGCPFMYWDESGDLMGDTKDNDFCSDGERRCD